MADGVLRDLDEHALARGQHRLDLARLPVLVTQRRPVDLAGVEDGVAALADVDERRLHRRQDVLHPAEVDVADQRGLRLAGDVVLDEDLVLENRDLGDVVALADGHHPVDRLAAGEELRLADDGRPAPAGLPALATALLLGLEPGGAGDGGDLVLRGAGLADPRGGLVGVVAGLGAVLARTAAPAAAARAGRLGGLGVSDGLGRLVVGLGLAVGGLVGPALAAASAAAPATAARAARTVVVARVVARLVAARRRRPRRRVGSRDRGVASPAGAESSDGRGRGGASRRRRDVVVGSGALNSTAVAPSAPPSVVARLVRPGSSHPGRGCLGRAPARPACGCGAPGLGGRGVVDRAGRRRHLVGARRSPRARPRAPAAFFLAAAFFFGCAFFFGLLRRLLGRGVAAPDRVVASGVGAGARLLGGLARPLLGRWGVGRRSVSVGVGGRGGRGDEFVVEHVRSSARGLSLGGIGATGPGRVEAGPATQSLSGGDTLRVSVNVHDPSHPPRSPGLTPRAAVTGSGRAASRSGTTIRTRCAGPGCEVGTGENVVGSRAPALGCRRTSTVPEYRTPDAVEPTRTPPTGRRSHLSTRQAGPAAGA